MIVSNRITVTDVIVLPLLSMLTQGVHSVPLYNRKRGPSSVGGVGLFSLVHYLKRFRGSGPASETPGRHPGALQSSSH